MIEYRMLTDAEKAILGTTLPVAIALDGPTVVCYFIFRIPQTNELCNTCTSNCIQGQSLYTLQDHRHQGIFRKVFDFALAQVGRDGSKLYHGATVPTDYSAISWKYGVQKTEERDSREVSITYALSAGAAMIEAIQKAVDEA